MALDTLRATVWPPSDVPLDRAGRRLLRRRDRTVRAELYHRRRDWRFHPGLAADRSGPVCTVDHVPADCRIKVMRHGNVENCRLRRWKTHSQHMEKDKPFPHPANKFPTAPPGQAVYAHSHNACGCENPSYPFLSGMEQTEKKHKKRAGVQPSDEPRSCTPVFYYGKCRKIRLFFRTA